jgi:hypothetical protein
MPTQERIIEIDAELAEIESKLQEYESVLKKMPGGCTCNATGKQNKAAKDAYKRDFINPLKDRQKILITEKNS